MNFNNKNPNLVDEKIIKYHLNKLYNNNLNSHMIGGNPKPLLPNPIIPNIQQLSYGLPPLPKDINIPQNPPHPIQPMQIPQQPMQIPQQPMQIPQQPMPVPQQPMPVPQQPMPVPQQPMPVPQQPMPVPQQPMPVPQQLIQLPQQQGMLPQNYMYMQPEQPPNFFMKIFLSLKNYLIEFIKENYGFVLIITLLIILLYVRYIEVSKKKEKYKNNI
jgi:hypothetical protein